MNWIFVIIGGVLLFIIFKILLKAVKIALLLSIVALFMVFLWFWHQGFIFK